MRDCSYSDASLMQETCEFLAAVLKQAVADYLLLVDLGLARDRQLLIDRWPTHTAYGRTVYSQVHDHFLLEEAESAIEFLFHGGADRFFAFMGVDIFCEPIINALLAASETGKEP